MCISIHKSVTFCNVGKQGSFIHSDYGHLVAHLVVTTLSLFVMWVNGRFVYISVILGNGIIFNVMLVNGRVGETRNWVVRIKFICHHHTKCMLRFSLYIFLYTIHVQTQGKEGNM
jgi:hypothetical protein